MNKQVVVSIIGVVALLLKLIFDVEIEQIVQAELADLLVNIALIVAPVAYAVRSKLNEKKANQKKEDTP